MAASNASRKRKTTENNHGSKGSASAESAKNEGHWWEKLSSKTLGHSRYLGSYESLFKVSKKTFDYICDLVKVDMMDKSASFMFLTGEAMSLFDKVAVALRRMGSGESLATIGETFGLSQSTVAKITWKFVESMEERAIHHLMWPSTEAEMDEIKSKFESMQGLPNCCGAIDLTHIILCLSAFEENADAWLDHRKKHSMVLQAIVDPNMRFMDIVTGWPGEMQDWLVFENSNFSKLCDQGKRLNGKPLKLSAQGSNSEIREYIVGDLGYPLMPYLLVPYDEESQKLTGAEQEFNRMHCATRMVAQKALAKLKGTWKIIDGIMWRPDKHRLPRIILVCCLLHNIVIDMEDAVEVSPSHDHDSGYKQLVCGAVDEKGVAQRQNLTLYLAGFKDLSIVNSSSGIGSSNSK